MTGTRKIFQFSLVVILILFSLIIVGLAYNLSNIYRSSTPFVDSLLTNVTIGDKNNSISYNFTNQTTISNNVTFLSTGNEYLVITIILIILSILFIILIVILNPYTTKDFKQTTDEYVHEKIDEIQKMVNNVINDVKDNENVKNKIAPISNKVDHLKNIFKKGNRSSNEPTEDS